MPRTTKRPMRPSNPNLLSDEDQELYEQLVWRLHSLTFALTTRFLKDPDSRKKISQGLDDYAKVWLGSDGGCGDPLLCYSKERGCSPCSDQPAKKG